MFKAFIRPATDYRDRQDVRTTITNGTHNVSVMFEDQAVQRRTAITLILDPDDAIELAAGLLIHATNVQLGFHGNSAEALGADLGARARSVAQGTLTDWMQRMRRDEEKAEIREILEARGIEDAEIRAAQVDL